MTNKAYLTRAPACKPGGWLFTIGADAVDATPENDCCVPFQAPEPGTDTEEPPDYPACPDCNGPITPFRTETSHGLLRCTNPREGDKGCGSVFADSRSHWYSRKHRCDRHSEGITDAPIWDADEPWTLKAHDERDNAEVEFKEPPEHLYIFQLTQDRRTRWQVTDATAVVAVLDFAADGYLYGALMSEPEHAEMLRGLGITGSAAGN